MSENNISAEIRSGVICINKPAGITSHDVVNKIRRLYSTKQVGHTGTLDPMASGVLPVMIGRAVKASEYLSADRKRYCAGLKLGIKTDTQDTTGETTHLFGGELPDIDDVKNCALHFTGTIMQTPPMYSALKVNGQKLYDLARKGIEVERSARKIQIYRLDVSPTDASDEYILDVECSSGTYIRTLCADIGSSLGCGGVMSSLVRTACGSFDIMNSVTLEQLEKMDEETRYGLKPFGDKSILYPVESLFSELPKVVLPDFFASLAHNGNEIYLAKIKVDIPESTRVRMNDKNGFFALGEICKYPAGLAIKPIKQFRL